MTTRSRIKLAPFIGERRLTLIRLGEYAHNNYVVNLEINTTRNKCKYNTERYKIKVIANIRVLYSESKGAISLVEIK